MDHRRANRRRRRPGRRDRVRQPQRRRRRGDAGVAGSAVARSRAMRRTGCGARPRLRGDRAKRSHIIVDAGRRRFTRLLPSRRRGSPADRARPGGDAGAGTFATRLDDALAAASPLPTGSGGARASPTGGPARRRRVGGEELGGPRGYVAALRGRDRRARPRRLRGSRGSPCRRHRPVPDHRQVPPRASSRASSGSGVAAATLHPRRDGVAKPQRRDPHVNLIGRRRPPSPRRSGATTITVLLRRHRRRRLRPADGRQHQLVLRERPISGGSPIGRRLGRGRGPDDGARRRGLDRFRAIGPRKHLRRGGLDHSFSDTRFPEAANAAPALLFEKGRRLWFNRELLLPGLRELALYDS